MPTWQHSQTTSMVTITSVDRHYVLPNRVLSYPCLVCHRLSQSLPRQGNPTVAVHASLVLGDVARCAFLGVLEGAIALFFDCSSATSQYRRRYIMQLLSFLAISGLAASVAGRSMQSVGKREELPKPRIARPHPSRNVHPVKRQSTSIITTEASKSM
jgi:hypothetical protein